MKKNKSKLISFLFLFHQLVSLGQNHSPLFNEVEKLKSDSDLKNASWSVCVMPVKKDTVLFEYNSHLSLIPASTLKAITTGAALLTLGEDFRFKTYLKYDGEIDTNTGTLNGNLYIVGGGDPTLESRYFKNREDKKTVSDNWASIIKEKGIKKITGQVIGDAGIFEENIIPSQWIWSDIGNYYGAGVSGLSYHDNAYSVYLKSGQVGEPTQIVKCVPSIPELSFINNVIANGNTDSAYIYGAPYSFDRIIEGSIPPNRSEYKVNGSIPDPALFCAQSLSQSLKNIGVEVSKNATTIQKVKKEKKGHIDSNLQTIYVHTSPALSDIVYWCNLKSVNLYAEHMLKYMAFVKSGSGTEQEGVKYMSSFWKNKGINMDGFSINDGSGLSRSNILTTKTQTEILRNIANSKYYNTFNRSLPVAGKNGSLASMCKGTSAENNLRAKSGYMNNVRAYTGYTQNQAGELICFSVIFNNYSCSPYEMKRKIEKLLVAITELK